MGKATTAVAGAIALAASLTVVGVAGAQEETPETTAPSTEAPATTAAPAPTDAPATTEGPATTIAAPDTTLPPAIDPPEDQAPPADPGVVLEPLALPGNVVTSGTLEFGVSFADSPSSSCNGNVALSSGQFNVGYDETGKVGGVYGLTSTGSGTMGALVVGLGPIPAGVAVVSVSDANCEFDAIGVGGWSATATTARLNGIGFGLHPGAYDTGSYVDRLSVSASIGATGGPASLDLNQLQSFLLRDRPGLDLDLELPAE